MSNSLFLTRFDRELRKPPASEYAGTLVRFLAILVLNFSFNSVGNLLPTTLNASIIFYSLAVAVPLLFIIFAILGLRAGAY